MAIIVIVGIFAIVMAILFPNACRTVFSFCAFFAGLALVMYLSFLVAGFFASDAVKLLLLLVSFVAYLVIYWKIAGKMQSKRDVQN